MKGIAIFGVVLYHVGIVNIADATGFAYYLNVIVDSAISISMAIFFFVNGFLLMSKTEIDIGKHYLKLLKNLLVLWFWSALCLLVISIYRHEYLSVKDVLISIFILKNGWNHYLWFFYAYLGISACYPLVLKIYQNHKRLYMTAMIAISIIGYGLWLVYNVSCVAVAHGHIGGLKIINAIKPFYITATVRALYIVPSFLIGGACNYFKDKLSGKPARIAITVIAVAAFAAMTICNVIIVKDNPYNDIIERNFSSPTAMLVALALFVNLINVKPTRFATVMGAAGKYSLGIYLIHWYFTVLLWDTAVRAEVAPNASAIFLIGIALLYLLASLALSAPLYKNESTKVLFLK